MTTIALATYAVLAVMVAVNALMSIVVLIGGWFDLRSLLRDLSDENEDVTDDGRVDDPPGV